MKSVSRWPQRMDAIMTLKDLFERAHIRLTLMILQESSVATLELIESVERRQRRSSRDAESISACLRPFPVL